MPRRSLADEAKLEALRIAELCRLMNRDAAVRRRLPEYLLLEQSARIAALRNLKTPTSDSAQHQQHAGQQGRGRRRGGRGRRGQEPNPGTDSAASTAAAQGDITSSPTTIEQQQHSVELPELTPPSPMGVEAPPASELLAAEGVVAEKGPLHLQPEFWKPPQNDPPRRSLQSQLSKVAMESTQSAPPPPPPAPPPPLPSEQPWQTPTKKGKARRKEPQQTPPPPEAAGPSRDPDEKPQEPPATPRKHKTPKKPGNVSLETYVRKQNRAASFKGGAASAMLEDDDFYDNL